jgi:hypothetical protein
MAGTLYNDIRAQFTIFMLGSQYTTPQIYHLSRSRGWKIVERNETLTEARDHLPCGCRPPESIPGVFRDAFRNPNIRIRGLHVQGNF